MSFEILLKNSLKKIGIDILIFSFASYFYKQNEKHSIYTF